MLNSRNVVVNLFSLKLYLTLWFHQVYILFTVCWDIWITKFLANVYCQLVQLYKMSWRFGMIYCLWKICLISYRQTLETFYYIVVYILISLSYKDMYWNKCLYLFHKHLPVIYYKVEIKYRECFKFFNSKFVNHF